MTEEKKLLEAQMRDQQNALQKVKERLEAIARAEEAEKLEPLKATAMRAHDLLCPYNHTDGCGWGYENGNWRGAEHNRWLRKVDALVNGAYDDKPSTTLAEINVVLDAIQDLKPKVRTALSLIRKGLMP